jgi:malonyl-CoA O-methyltransferase
METVQKNRIKICFSKAWNTYDKYCHVQKQACEKAVEALMLQGSYYKTIVDFACGTGVSTQYIVNNFRFETLYAIDFSESLLEVARKKAFNGNVKYMLGDFDDILFPAGSLDLIFCNMGLQWSLNLRRTLDVLNSYLHNSGLVVFTMPLLNTFDGVDGLNNNFLYDVDSVGKLLEQCQYQVVTSFQEIYVEKFSSRLNAIRSIKSVGANCLLKSGNDPQKNMPRHYIKKVIVDESPCDLTYHIGIFVAKKKWGYSE